jgi:hypothetical protein
MIKVFIATIHAGQGGLGRSGPVSIVLKSHKREQQFSRFLAYQEDGGKTRRTGYRQERLERALLAKFREAMTAPMIEALAAWSTPSSKRPSEDHHARTAEPVRELKRLGARCAVCEKPVTKDEMEFEIQFAHDGASPARDKYHFHIRCFAARDDFVARRSLVTL